MARPIKSILLLIMIFVAASGIPLYADTLSFDFDFDFTMPFSSSQENPITIDTSITMLSSSHPQLQIALGVDDRQLPLQFKDENPIELSLYFQKKLVANLEIEELDMNDDLSTTFSIDVPQNKFDVPNGSYELKVKVNLDNIENPIISDSISVDYFAVVTYNAALETIDRDQSALTLYFPDNNANYLIPITRVLPYTRTPLRSTIDNLIQGPKEELGLLLDSPIPATQGLSLDRGVANIFLSRDLGIYEEYSSSARIAVESFVNSLASINEVQAVQFYFDNTILTDGFHGMVMNEPIYPTSAPQLYAGYITNTDRFLLIPVALDTTNPTVSSLFNGLKYSGGHIAYNYNLQPTVPEEVVLLDYHSENHHLRLKLNEAFVTAYADYPDYRKAMIDSILYTFTSLDDIDSVEFEIEGLSSTIPEDIILNSPLEPSPFINPEG